MYNKNSSDNIFLDEPSGELTFGKIFKIIKFAFTRALVYILIACIIAGALSLVLTVAGNKDSVSTIIEYKYNGINQGLTPAGDKFSIDRIKNTNVLESAIANVDIKDKSKLTSNNLFTHIKIKEVIPSDVLAQVEKLKTGANKDASTNSLLAGMKYFPNRFVIYIDKYKELGLSEKDAVALLNEVIKAHQIEWIDSYVTIELPDGALFDDIINNGIKHEFVMYDTMLAAKYFSLDQYMTRNKDVKFVSSEGDTFQALMSELEALPNQIEMFNSYVVNNKAVKNANDAINLLVAQEAALKAEYEALSQNIADTKEYLKNWQPNSTITKNPNGTTDTVNSYPPAYTEQMKALDKLLAKQSDCAIKKDNATRKLFSLGYYSDVEGTTVNPGNVIEPNEDINATASAMLVNLCKDFKNVLDRTNKLNDEYRENTPITKDITMVMPAANSGEKVISNKAILGIFLLAIVIAGIAALVVTTKKQKAFAFSVFFPNKTKANDAKAEVVEDTKTDEVEDTQDNE